MQTPTGLRYHQSDAIPFPHCLYLQYFFLTLLTERKHPGHASETEELDRVQVRIRRGLHGARGTTNENAKFGGVQVLIAQF